MAEIPEFENEDEERAFWATHDSIDYLDGAEQVTIEHQGENITSSNVKYLRVQVPNAMVAE